MDEIELIHRLTARLPGNENVVIGPGDDCAVLDFGMADRWLLFKTDAVVEGIHFDRQVTPDKIGHKALARCVSDIAAMAGIPTAALVTLALPSDFDPDFIEVSVHGIGSEPLEDHVGRGIVTQDDHQVQHVAQWKLNVIGDLAADDA